MSDSQLSEGAIEVEVEEDYSDKSDEYSSPARSRRRSPLKASNKEEYDESEEEDSSSYYY